jgi:glutathione S-transferase
MGLTHTLQATLICCFHPQRWVEEGHAAAAAEVKARRAARRRRRRPARVRAGAPRRAVAARRGRGTADAYALMLCRWTRHFARPASRLPTLGEYLRRGLERPAVRAVFEREAIPQPWV